MKHLNDNFSEGSWVYFNNPNHQFHLMMFQINRIIPATAGHRGGYELVYGNRSIIATADEMLPKGHPSLKSLILAAPYSRDNATPATDVVYEKIANEIFNPHHGHEIVENHAGGKAFKYCRNCKVEVNE